MNVSIYLDDELGSLLDKEVKQTGKTRNALIREAIKEWFLHHKTQDWPQSILHFNGIADFPSLESSRDELLPPEKRGSIPMTYLLDTCAISDFIKGEPNTLQKIKSVSPSEIVISSITVMELQYGLALNPEKAKKLTPMIDDFLSTITLLGFHQAEAKIAGNLRASLKKQGQLIGYYDILLAATALCHQLIFVSSNIQEFERIPKLRLENWRD